MLFNYVLTHVRVGKVAQDASNPSKQNVGQYFITGILKNPAFRNAKNRDHEMIWYQDDPDFVDAVRSLFPKIGKDSDGNDWNGSAEIDAATFNPDEAETTLRNYRGTDWLVFKNGKFIEAELDGPYCMKYSQDLGSHKKDDWVCDASGTFVKVWKTIKVFVCMYDEASNQYVEGWSLKERLDAKLRNMLPLAVAVKQAPEKVDPRYLSEYIVPSVRIDTQNSDPAPATNAPNPDAVNEER